MGETNNKKKKVITIVISILIVLVLVLAISYAFFSTQLSGTDQIVKVEELELVLDETSEGISLDNAIGISDSKGMSSTPSTFELRNNGSKAVDYTIYLDDNTISDTDTRIDDKYLKYNLNKNGSDSGATLLTKTGTNPNRVLDSGTIEGGGTNKYSLNLWITDEVDGNYSGQVFSGKLRVEVSQAKPGAGDTILAGLTSGDTYDDDVDTFITGTDPNNYIWYSGKLWRAVSVNNEAKTTKLVTQWNISAITYSSGSTDFAGSYMEDWLNDTSVDGFLGNLRDYENFIVMDATWDATMDATDLGSITRPNGTTTVSKAVGLLNIYEYQTSYTGTTYGNGYLNNGLMWWTLTPYSASNVRIVNSYGDAFSNTSTNASGVRPSINLKSSVRIVDGNGTIENPYRLEGDNDTSLSGTLLSSRYSGEYVRFGNDENNLYRIVSHETSGLTKITSAEPLKNSGTFITSAFGSSNSEVNYSTNSVIGTFLNGEYLTNYVGNAYSDMIEDSTTWYLGTVGSSDSYKLAKYTDTNMSSTVSTTTNAKVGLLRFGELMAGQFERCAVKGSHSSTGLTTNYWTLTPYSSSHVRDVINYGHASYTYSALASGVRPSINLKSNVVITGGLGTKEQPFELSVQ